MRPPESFINQHIRSLQTMLRVIAEDAPLLPSVIPDGIYGESTVTAVTAFQRREGLPQTGITDQETWEQIVKRYESAIIQIDKAEPIEIIMNSGEDFRIGSQNPYIRLLQSMLYHLSEAHPNISEPTLSGILDKETSNALASFQQLSSLPITGELDKVTWKHLVHQFTLSANRKAYHPSSYYI